MLETKNGRGGVMQKKSRGEKRENTRVREGVGELREKRMQAREKEGRGEESAKENAWE